MVSRLVVILRLSATVAFLAVSFTVSWSSFLSLILLLVTLFAFGNTEKTNTQKKIPNNPYKYLKDASVSDLDRETQDLINNELLDYIIYDAENCEMLRNFSNMKQRSDCIFARQAKIWGALTWNDELPFELNVLKTIPTFAYFSILCTRICLDGFLFELPGHIYGDSTEVFGAAVWKLLKVVSDNDPAQRSCMERRLDSNSWVFEFNKVTFFITTFAPCYPKTSSRYGFGSEHCYVLFQPEVSFARHDLPLDNSVTNWTNPKTVRDRIRIAFKDAGREYVIRETTAYPMAHDIVKPIDGENLVTWWTTKDSEKAYKVFGQN